MHASIVYVIRFDRDATVDLLDASGRLLYSAEFSGVDGISDSELELQARQLAGVGAEYYSFAGGDGWCWVEAFDELGHWVSPTPRRDAAVWQAEQRLRRPGAVIDELCYGDEIGAARQMADSGICADPRCRHSHPLASRNSGHLAALAAAR